MSPWPLSLGATKPGEKVNRFTLSVFFARSVAETTPVHCINSKPVKKPKVPPKIYTFGEIEPSFLQKFAQIWCNF
jgi:hypothetical protein